MIQVYENLFVGTTADCFYDEREDSAVVHACKTPCHQRKLGYTKNLPSTHPNYLILEEGNHLYLNIVDMAQLMPKFVDPIFFKALEFIENNISDRQVIIHCNLGQSRSPGIALTYMAKKELIPKTSYSDAVTAFRLIYPNYAPGRGVDNYLRENWKKLVN